MNQPRETQLKHRYLHLVWLMTLNKLACHCALDEAPLYYVILLSGDRYRLFATRSVYGDILHSFIFIPSDITLLTPLSTKVTNANTTKFDAPAKSVTLSDLHEHANR